MEGYDLDLIASVPSAGRRAGRRLRRRGLGRATSARRCARAAPRRRGGSMFVFHGPHRAVLITYPSRAELEEALP